MARDLKVENGHQSVVGRPELMRLAPTYGQPRERVAKDLGIGKSTRGK
jgi:predicted transcriptional regulator